MKIKKGYLLREVAGNCVVVPAGKAALDFSGVITLNESGAFLWKLLEKDMTQEELLSAMLDEYEVGPDAARTDIADFLAKLEAAGLVE